MRRNKEDVTYLTRHHPPTGTTLPPHSAVSEWVLIIILMLAMVGIMYCADKTSPRDYHTEESQHAGTAK